jgi:hypothetical protein
MKLGDTIQTTAGPLVLDDRVLSDRSCGQYESGWWAFTPGKLRADDPMFFVSDGGEVFSNSEKWPDAYDVQVGKVI